MKKRLTFVALALMLVAAMPLFVDAAPGPHGGKGMRGHGGGGGMFNFLHRLDRLKAELDLTEEQTTQIRAIIRDTHEQNRAFREQMHGTMMEVAKTLLANPNDLAGAQAIVDRQAEAERALKANLLQAASKALNVLTPEQRTKLATHLAEHAGRWQRRGR